MPESLLLPNLSTRPIEGLLLSRPPSEIIHMITSLVASRQMDKVEYCAAQIKEKMPEDWNLACKSFSILNMLVEAYLELNELEKAERWRILLWKNQDPLTFALFYRHLIGQNLLARCVILYKEMEEQNITFDSVWDTKILSFRDRVTLATIRPNIKIIPSEHLLENEAEQIDISVLNLSASEAKAAGPPTNQLIPVVNPIDSKSRGIYFVKDSLKALANNPAIDRFVIQEQLERDCYNSTLEKFRSELESFQRLTNSPNLTGIKVLLSRWHAIFTLAIKNILNDVENTFLADNKLAYSGPVAGQGFQTEVTFLYGAILAILDPAKISIICLQELTRISTIEPDIGGIPITKLALTIGSYLEKEAFAHQVSQRKFLQATQIVPKQLSELFHSRKVFDKLMRKTYAELEENLEARQNGWMPRWSQNLKAELGAFLVKQAIITLQLEDGTPAFQHGYGTRNGRNYGVLRLSHQLIDQLSSSLDSATINIEPWAMPMVVPPRPWLTYNSGGYLTHRNIYVRLKEDPIHLAFIHQANSKESADQILIGLDILGSTPWYINERVFKVALELWNSGINVSTLEKPTALFSSVAEALDKKSGKYRYRSKDSFATKQEYICYVRDAMNFRSEAAKSHSTMCDTNYKLEIARQFLGIPFYLPHSVDFRGRAYPIPPHLNHIGSDLSRGLLIFAEGKPLGKQGLRWLKIQLANMYGVDKAPFDERVAFVDSHLTEIFNSADDPINGKQWWKSADEPWQCLAACVELTNALRSTNFEEYISHLPVQQDGSCNGLQHYAAMGGDVGGAAQVNLIPASKPQDIYGEVARLVSQRISTDASSGNSLAMMLQGKINRKIVKQPVMTNVYGVTIYGARKQIEDRIIEYKLVPKEHINDARNYLVSLVFDSLQQLFTNAKRIQDWLADTAVEISMSVSHEVASKLGYEPRYDYTKLYPNCRKYWMPGTKGKHARQKSTIDTSNIASQFTNEIGGKLIENFEIHMNEWETNGQQEMFRQKMEQNINVGNGLKTKYDKDPSIKYPQTPVVWETPLGFRVVQPYLCSKTIQLKTVLQSLSIREPSIYDIVDVHKQSSAFPPNFVHSLDATHMFKTAVACHKANITFASVHDCFWTHASTIDIMSRHIREQFIDLHARPILEEMHQDLLKRYAGYKVPICIGSEEAEEEGKRKRKRVWRDIWIPPPPPKGNLDLNLVMDSEYFFS